MFTDVVSDSTLQPTFKKLPLVESKNVHNYLIRLLKIVLPFLTVQPREAGFSSYTINKTTESRLTAEAGMGFQRSPIKTDMNEVCKKEK